MPAYIIQRILQIIPLIFLILTINFVILHLAPGDPVSFFVQGGAGATQEFVDNIRKQFGLDKPLGAQLGIFLANVCRGNLGYSLYYQDLVIRVIGERMPVTFLLVSLATLFAAIGGIGLGVVAGKYPYSIADRITMVVAVVGYSIPVFWFGQMLIILFAVQLKLLPVGGVPIAALGQGGFVDWCRSLVLPVIGLGVVHLGLIARITRANMLEILGADYITTARAKGVRESVITFKHALRNAILPVITAISVNMGFVLTGAMLTETVFSWPGLGRMMFDSLMRRDYPVLMGLLVVMSVGITTLNLLTDLIYAYLDPRIVYT
ncbi:MAG TPA: ABC transporter permease [Candidatus Heimdallarchaeota archaeon]|nr:ABC transporter permease [Candidatus Heimdallarchaeota archaeon]